MAALASQGIVVDVLSLPFVDGDGVVGVLDEDHHRTCIREYHKNQSQSFEFYFAASYGSVSIEQKDWQQWMVPAVPS